MRSACNKSLVIILSVLGLIISSLPSRGINPADTLKIPDSLLAYDALILSKEMKFVYRIHNFETFYLFEDQYVHKRIRILTEKGVQDYATSTIPVNRFSKIKDFRIMVHKSNGDSVLVETDFYNVQNPGDNKFIGEKEMRFSVPGLQTGDILDVQIRIENRTGFRYPYELFFNESVPSLNVSYTLQFVNLVSQLKTYHGLPLPETSFQKNDTSYSWNFPYLKAIPSENNAIHFNNTPFVRYMLLKPARPVYGVSIVIADTWSEVFQDFSRIEKEKPKKKKSEYFDEFMNARLSDCQNMSDYEKFQKIYQYIQDSIEVVELQKKTNYCSGYYLYTGKINSFRLLKLYMDLCRYFHYDYYFTLARSKFKGEIDEEFVTSDMYDAVLFTFRDEKGTMHYLRTSYVRKRGIDEIHPEFAGTRAFLVNPKDISTYEMSTIPTSDNNFEEQEGMIRIEPDSNTADLDFRLHYKGFPSLYYSYRYDPTAGADSARLALNTDLNKQYSNLQVERCHFGKPSLFPPFPYDVSYGGERTGIVTRIDQDIYNLPLNYWMEHSVIRAEEETRQTDYYLLYAFTSSFSYRIVFPYPVELLNSQKLQTDYSNPYGSVTLLVKQENDTTLTLNSVYKIAEDLIPAGDYSMLKKINESWEHIKDASLLFRRKKPVM